MVWDRKKLQWKIEVHIGFLLLLEEEKVFFAAKKLSSQFSSFLCCICPRLQRGGGEGS
jgi:hypothetical protein